MCMCLYSITVIVSTILKLKPFSQFRLQLQNTVVTESIAFANNVITCQFTRKESLVGDSSFSDISGANEYYILLAMGSTINGDGKIIISYLYI